MQLDIPDVRERSHMMLQGRGGLLKPSRVLSYGGEGCGQIVV